MEVMRMECEINGSDIKDANKMFVYKVYVDCGEIKKGKEKFKLKKEFKIFTDLTKALQYEDELKRRKFKNRTVETIEVDKRTFHV